MPTLAEWHSVAVNSPFAGVNTLRLERDGLNSKRVDSVESGIALSASGGAR